jgi:hypothetical protein
MVTFITWLICVMFAFPYYMLFIAPLYQTTLVSITNVNCYAKEGHIHAEQFIIVTGNKTALFDCGRVISCSRLSCYKPGDIVYITGCIGC